LKNRRGWRSSKDTSCFIPGLERYLNGDTVTTSITTKVLDTGLQQYGPDEEQKKQNVIRAIALVQGAFASLILNNDL